MCISGGAALPVEVLRGFEEAFGVPVLEGNEFCVIRPKETLIR
jgi:hypothetical protein